MADLAKKFLGATFAVAIIVGCFARDAGMVWFFSMLLGLLFLLEV